MLRSHHAAFLKIVFLLTALILNASTQTLSTIIAANASTKTKVFAIAEARRLPPGTLVTIDGVVTVPSGAFKSSISDEGFAIQDGSGGIYVSMTVNPGLRIGQRVRVAGKLADSNGLLMLVPVSAGDVRIHGRARAVMPQVLPTGKVNEATEGRLLKVEGRITRAVVSDLPYGFRLFLDDGTGEIQIYVSASTKIDVTGLQPRQYLSVTGFCGQYKDHYEIEPRFAPDIVKKVRIIY